MRPSQPVRSPSESRDEISPLLWGLEVEETKVAFRERRVSLEGHKVFHPAHAVGTGIQPAHSGEEVGETC